MSGFTSSRRRIAFGVAAAACALVPAAAAASDWRVAGGMARGSTTNDKKFVTLVDMASIKRTAMYGREITFWKKTVYHTPVAGADHVDAWIRVDCAKRSYRILQTNYQLGLIPVRTTGATPEAMLVFGSMTAMEANLACGDMPLDTPTVVDPYTQIRGRFDSGKL